jgi:hypothetical protein
VGGSPAKEPLAGTNKFFELMRKLKNAIVFVPDITTRADLFFSSAVDAGELKQVHHQSKHAHPSFNNKKQLPFQVVRETDILRNSHLI